MKVHKRRSWKSFTSELPYFPLPYFLCLSCSPRFQLFHGMIEKNLCLEKIMQRIRIKNILSDGMQGRQSLSAGGKNEA